MSGALSDHFTGVGVKVLRATEVDPSVSRGHELQGIAQFRQFLGGNVDGDELPVTYVWLSDDGPPVSLPLTGTWYDSRRNNPGRSPEYRFYYPTGAEDVVYRARAGDTLFLCQPRRGPLLALFCARGSSIERQLLFLFRLDAPSGELLRPWEVHKRDRQLDFISRYILDLIGIGIIETEERLLDRLLQRFGETFPPTKEFSHFARESFDGADAIEDPDGALLAWVDFEERLFMTLEKHIVGQRLLTGFNQGGSPDVDGFISYSLSVQNRRKSRAGLSLANHMEALLVRHRLRFKREATTEKRAGADFLFPGEADYHDPEADRSQLVMLAAKTTCKDRWRQVLAEADHIQTKHLLTLEPGISRAQTDEMKRASLQLVLPAPLHQSYLPEQQSGLLAVGDFLALVRSRQAA